MIKIKTDSRKIEPGDTFVAIKGERSDGHDYVLEAIKNGAKRVVVEKGLYENIETVKVPDTKEYLIEYLKDIYYPFIKDLKLLGITGTNGKTTTAYLMYQLLNKLGIKAAYIGTIGFYLGDKYIELANTTPEITELYDLLLQCEQEKVKCVCMEVSSHALAQRRVGGLQFDAAIFSNLTKDHLDYHKTMEDYALCKKKLFDNLKEDGTAIINIDDPFGKIMIPTQGKTLTYGFAESDYQIIGECLSSHHGSFRFMNKTDFADVESKLLGRHNVYNLISAIAALEAIGVAREDILAVTKDLKAPRGRMDTIKYGNNTIIVDYAHTPDAIKNVISSVKQFSKGKIYSIIGCGGDRDKTKRLPMAKIATDLSDEVIITSDNPRTEDPKAIVDDMINGLDNLNYHVVINRKEAIEQGIEKLGEHDILLILGKGHEDYQIIGTTKYHHDDKEYALSIIKKR